MTRKEQMQKAAKEAEPKFGYNCDGSPHCQSIGFEMGWKAADKNPDPDKTFSRQNNARGELLNIANQQITDLETKLAIAREAFVKIEKKCTKDVLAESIAYTTLEKIK